MIHKRQRVSEAKRSGGLISTRACRRNRWHETGLLMDGANRRNCWHETGLLMDGANRRNCWREMGLLMDGANRRGFRQARWLMALVVLVTPLVLVAQPGLATGPGPVVHGEVAPIEGTPIEGIEGLTVELFSRRGCFGFHAPPIRFKAHFIRPGWHWRRQVGGTQFGSRSERGTRAARRVILRYGVGRRCP